jgi:hypothetical protein
MRERERDRENVKWERVLRERDQETNRQTDRQTEGNRESGLERVYVGERDR